MAPQPHESAQNQMTRPNIPWPQATLEQLTEKLLSLELDESVAPIARALAGIAHIQTDYIRLLVELRGRDRRAIKMMDERLAELIEAVSPLVAQAQQAQRPESPAAPAAQKEQEFAGSMSDEEMAEQIERENAAEFAKVEALALRKDVPVQAQIEAAQGVLPARKAGAAARKAPPPTGQNGGAA